MTGASGFVGSNIAKVFADRHGDTVIDDRVDMTQREAVLAHVAATEPHAVIHCAILNDWQRMQRDRALAWSAYVEATRAYADAARAAGVPFCLVSTDWVFDGTQSGAAEDTPPNPVNLYGFLKAASEIVALDRGGSVARVSGVNGTHWARPSTPRAQDPGFGYFVASIVDHLERDEPFTVWEGDELNTVASPSLASMCGEVIRAIVASGHDRCLPLLRLGCGHSPPVGGGDRRDVRARPVTAAVRCGATRGVRRTAHPARHLALGCGDRRAAGHSPAVDRRDPRVVPDRAPDRVAGAACWVRLRRSGFRRRKSWWCLRPRSRHRARSDRS